MTMPHRIVVIWIAGMIASAAIWAASLEANGEELRCPLTDVFRLEKVDEDTAQFCYCNSIKSSSINSMNLKREKVNGLGVEIRVEVRSGDLPETVEVTPPITWYAEPQSLTIVDRSSACLMIRRIPLG